jgi:general secretion pathway protein L
MDLEAAISRLRRVEFIGDGLGVYVGPHEVALAHLSKGLLRLSVRDVLAMPLPGREHQAERRQALTDAVLGFVRSRRLAQAPAVLALHRSQALFNRLVLPAAAAENIRDVVEYEMERVIPLPKSELYYEFTMRPFGADRVEVLIMCLPQAAVRDYLAALEDALVRPRGVVVSSAAVADFFCYCQGDASGPAGFVLRADGDLEFALVAERRLVASVLLPVERAKGEGDFARLLTREITDELVGVDELRLYRLGSANGSGPSALLGAEDLWPLGQDRFEAPPDFFSGQDPAILPALGAALGAVHEGTVAVNFLPGEARGSEGARWLVTAVLVLVLMVVSLAWGVSVVATDAMQRAELEAELERLRPKVATVKKMEEAAGDLRRQLETVVVGLNRHSVDYLREVTDLLPDDAYLTTFRLRGTQVQLDGFARAASELIPKLEESKHFKDVKFASPTTKVQGRDRFSIALEIE